MVVRATPLQDSSTAICRALERCRVSPTMLMNVLKTKVFHWALSPLGHDGWCHCAYSVKKKKLHYGNRTDCSCENGGGCFKQKHGPPLAYYMETALDSPGWKVCRADPAICKQVLQHNAITSDAINHNPFYKCHVYLGITMRVCSKDNSVEGKIEWCNDYMTRRNTLPYIHIRNRKVANVIAIWLIWACHDHYICYLWLYAGHLFFAVLVRNHCKYCV